LLFINQYGSVKLLQYYQNGNFQNLDEVITKYLFVSALKVKGYNVLHNLSEPLAYTFGEGRQQPFESMSNKPTVSFPYSIPFEFIQFYPITKLPNYQFPVFPISKLQVQLSKVSKQLQLLIPKLVSKIVIPHFIAGTQFQFSGSVNVQQLIENYLNPSYLQSWREIIIQNLGTSAVQINNSIYLMPKNCLKITASSPSEVQLTAQTPTLLSEEIEFTGIPTVAYTITITNSQAYPTSSPFQQLLNLNLSPILSSSSQLLNLEFCLDVNCNTPLYAWIESYNTNLSTVYIWVNLPVSIPANSSITIYMFVRNSIQYPYTGIAPNLTSTYAQYDNGENVFLFYDNFAGTSLNTNKWNYGYNSGGSITVNNGVTINYTSSSRGGAWIISNYNFPQSKGVVWYALMNFYGTSNFNDVRIRIYFWDTSYQVTGDNDSGNWGIILNNTDYGYFTNNYVGANTTQLNWGTQFTSTALPASTSQNDYNILMMQMLNANGLVWNTYTITNNNISLFQSFSQNGSVSGSFSILFEASQDGAGSASIVINITYTFLTTAPPNGVMPSNSQPQKTIVLVQ